MYSPRSDPTSTLRRLWMSAADSLTRASCWTLLSLVWVFAWISALPRR